PSGRAAATPAATDAGSAAGFDQNDFGSLGDLDTAGDAMAGYDAGADLNAEGSAGAGDGDGDGLDLEMNMEDDSAFGDAFHGVESSGMPAEGQDQDM
ncbi:hypothetical protein E4U41_001870, partial [Claviceps citrina]